MRLGRERPRKGRRCPTAAPASSGFNEAGARTPQKAARKRTAPRGNTPSFNEAGARTPQKGPQRPVPARRNRRFNEAGARTPQKGWDRWSSSSAKYQASMRLGRERPRKHADAQLENEVLLMLQ